MSPLLQNLIALATVAAVVLMYVTSRRRARRHARQAGSTGCGSGCGACAAPTHGCAVEKSPPA